MEPNVFELRDLVDGWNFCAAVGLTNPDAAAVTDSVGVLIAAVALLAGHRRPAATLSATSCAAWLASTLIHRGGIP